MGKLIRFEYPLSTPCFDGALKIMKRFQRFLSLTAIIGAIALGTPLVQGDDPIDEARQSLRHELLRLINRDRARFGLTPVQLDPYASGLADAYCERQIRYRTTGHFTVDGEAPYMRYSFAGGNDGMSENAAAWSANYRFTDRTVFELMRQSEEAMMAEIAPHDGHRQTILDPAATHVGIGLAWEGGEFRLTQEFVRRYVQWTRPLPRAATTGERVLCSGRPVPGYRVEAITVHREPLPQPLMAHVANLISTYSLPDLRREYLPRLGVRRWLDWDGKEHEAREEYTDGRKGDFQLDRDGGFAFAVPLLDGPGVYTVVVWVRKDGASQPISASNISIRVDHPETRFSTASLAGR